MPSFEIRQAVEPFPQPAFAELFQRVMADFLKPSDALSATLVEERHLAGINQTHVPIYRLGAYSGEELVGWSSGWMERGDSFYMASSGVVASHRRQGIYSALLVAVHGYAVSQGAVLIRSQHCVLNNSIIVAKLKRGFVISGLSQSAQMGMLVELICHLSDGRQRMFAHRALSYTEPRQ